MNVEAIVKAVNKIKPERCQVINAVRAGRQSIELWYDLPHPAKGNLIKVCSVPDFYGYSERIGLIYRDVEGVATPLHSAWDELLPFWVTTGYNLPTEIVL